GRPADPSQSSSYAGTAASPCHAWNSTPAGSSPAAAPRSMRLYEPARRLPLIPRRRISRGANELELGAQVDLPADGVPAVRKRELPVQVPIATIDRCAELQRRLLRAERVSRRTPIASVGGDRAADPSDRQLADDRGAAVGSKVDARRPKGQLR